MKLLKWQLHFSLQQVDETENDSTNENDSTIKKPIPKPNV